MDLLKTLHAVAETFVEFKPDEVSKPQETKAPFTSAAVSTPIAPTTTSPSLSTPTLALDDTMVAKLRNKLTLTPQWAAVQEFTSSMESLSDAIPDEGSRFRAVLKLLQKQNITPQTMIEAYQALSNVLESEKSQFAGVINSKKAQEITEREKSLDAINAQIKDLIDKRENIAIAMTEQKAKITNAETSFQNAVNAVNGEIGNMLDKFKLYAK